MTGIVIHSKIICGKFDIALGEHRTGVHRTFRFENMLSSFYIDIITNLAGK